MTRAAWACFALLAAAQIAVPLTDDDATLEWLSSLVVVAFAATSLALAARSWGATRAVASLGVVVVATFAVEVVGTRTGLPFGDYEYTPALEPQADGVPVIVPLAWFAMSVLALEVGRAVVDHPAGRVLVGAVALTAWDLFLDPQMVEAGYWVWDEPGWYQGIPWSNYAGWLATGVLLLAVLDRVRPPGPPETPALALYTWWAVMNTIGFVVFFGRPFVGLVGGAAMGACTVAAWIGARR